MVITSQLQSRLIIIIPNTFNHIPVFTMSFIAIFSVAKTKVLGGVATGSINANDAAIVRGTKKYKLGASTDLMAS